MLHKENMLWVFLVLATSPLASPEEKPDKYFHSLVDGYSKGKLTINHLKKICKNGTENSSEDIAISTVIGQNKVFCDFYLAGTIEGLQLQVRNSEDNTSQKADSLRKCHYQESIKEREEILLGKADSKPDNLNEPASTFIARELLICN